IEGVRVLTPIDPARSAALVTFTIEGVDGETASRRLRDEYRIMIKHITKPPNALRASIAFFNVETDIEQLIRAVSELRRRTQC
ncbi:MAG TPA: hypothetical protein VGV87_30115, partial [Blastocatellia bacterium]|nr:hypothetical protein [Blastocatellia bacterium]